MHRATILKAVLSVHNEHLAIIELGSR